jgi:hypothetical protein
MPDLRNTTLFTLGMLLIFRVLASLPVPLTADEYQALLTRFHTNQDQNLSQLLGLLDSFSGGSLQTFSIVALGVYPSITATIVMQLLQPLILTLQDLAQGEAGRLRVRSPYAECRSSTGFCCPSQTASDNTLPLLYIRGPRTSTTGCSWFGGLRSVLIFLEKLGQSGI